MADIKKIAGRIFEPMLVDMRGQRLNNEAFIQWKSRLRTVDALYRGDWSTVMPDDIAQNEQPLVMNLVQTAMDDIAALTAESLPSTVCPPTKETDTEEKNALFRQGIADTYSEVNKWDLLVPRLSMDFVGAGVALVAVSTDESSPYPCWYRIDPRNAYPDFFNGQLQDCLVVQTIRYRVAARLFPNLKMPENPEDTGWVEVLEYYSANECVQAVHRGATKSFPEVTEIVRRWDPKGTLPVAAVQRESFDGAIRGMFDQVIGSLTAKNRLVRLITDYADRQVYSPMFEKGVINREDPPSPGTMYHLDQEVQGAEVGYVGAASSSPEVMTLLEFLDREQRAGTAYPSARQGEVTQSIASASFVASTQGQLTSQIRHIQRALGSVLQRLNEISFKYDELFLDFDKPLSEPYDKRKTYKPSRDIAGVYANRVIYGAGAGLDRTAADVRVLQHKGAGLISDDTARQQIDYIRDPRGEVDKIYKEQAEKILLQQLESTGDVQTSMAVVAALGEGLSLTEAAKLVIAQQQAAQQAAAPGGPQEGTAGPMAPQAQQQGLAAGGIPDQQAALGLPPMEQVSVRPPSGGRPVQVH